MKNKLETLPKTIVYNGVYYVLDVHVTFRLHLCVCYKNLNRDDILCYVVEPDSEPYAPKSIESSNGIMNENIGNEKTLDDCIDRIFEQIDKLQLQVEYHD